MPNKKFRNKRIAELASLGDFNLISKSFELRAKISSFEIVEQPEIEKKLEEISQNLGLITVEASSTKDNFRSDESKKLLSNEEFTENMEID